MSAGGGGGGADSGEDVGGEVGGASDAIDPYDLLDPVDVLGELPKEFYTRIVRFFGFCQLCASPADVLLILNLSTPRASP